MLFTYAFIKIIKKYPGNPSRGVDEWKEIMNSFGVGEFLNNDLAVGAKGRVPSGDFYERRFKAIMKASGSKKLILQIGTRCQLALSIMGWGKVMCWLRLFS